MDEGSGQDPGAATGAASVLNPIGNWTRGYGVGRRTAGVVGPQPMVGGDLFDYLGRFDAGADRAVFRPNPDGRALPSDQLDG